MKLILALILSINISFAQSLIGSGANQVPTNGMLGSMAFEDNKNYTKSSSLGTMAFETASLYPKTSTLGTMAFENASDYSKKTVATIFGHSGDSGSFSTSSTSYVNVTNSSVTITPVRGYTLLSLSGISAASPVPCTVSLSGGTGTPVQGYIGFFDNTDFLLAEFVVFFNSTTSQTFSLGLPGSSYSFVNVGSGTMSYKVKAKASTGATISVSNCQLSAREV